MTSKNLKKIFPKRKAATFVKNSLHYSDSESEHADSGEEWKLPTIVSSSDSDSDNSLTEQNSSEGSAAEEHPNKSRAKRRKISKIEDVSLKPKKNTKHMNLVLISKHENNQIDFKRAFLPIEKFIVQDDVEEGESDEKKTKSKKKGRRPGKLHSLNNPLPQFHFPELNYNEQILKKKSRINLSSIISKSSSESESNWEDIESISQELNEAEFFDAQTLELLQNNNLNRSESIENPTLSLLIVDTMKVDPKKKRRMEIIKLRENKRIIHKLHLASFLCFSNYCNQKCDSYLTRALALSLSDFPYDSDDCDMEQLSFILEAFKRLIGTNIQFDLSKVFVNLHKNGKVSSNSAVILLVAYLRQIGFDTRIICSLKPLSRLLAPVKIKKYQEAKPLKSKKEFSLDTIKRRNLQILSSSDGDSDEIMPQASDTSEEVESCKIESLPNHLFVLSCEVYLPKLQSFIPCHPLFSDPRETLPWLHSLELIYSFAFHSQFPIFFQNENLSPYKDRSPVDVSGRYDKNWCENSIPQRVSEFELESLVKNMQEICNENILKIGNSLEMFPDHDNSLFLRDFCYSVQLRSQLTRLPKPNAIHCYKNHPLYVLKRFLGKNQVLYTPKGENFGKTKSGETIYPRECVFNCMSASNWLKEGKV